MSFLQGFVLGLVQGIGEFLPISSSGHLKLVQNFFNLKEVPLLFDVFLHLATLCAVVLFFRKRIWELLCAFGRLIARRPAPLTGTDSNGSKVTLSKEEADSLEKNRRAYILAVILVTVITGIIGVCTEKLINDSLPDSFIFIGFIFTGIFLAASSLFAGKKPAPECKAPSWKQAVVIGIAQGIGTLPGISRSGSTISASLFCGVNREMAGEFSFIASIPAILGAFILEAKDLGKVASTLGIAPIAAGCIAAFVMGYAALALLMKLIKNGKLGWFACYLIPAGILGLIFLGNF